MRPPETQRRRPHVLARAYLLGAALLIHGCAGQPSTGVDSPGFLLALWHGISAPFALAGALIAYLFPETGIGRGLADVRVYAFPNSGVFYDLGYLLGLSCWAGGAARGGRGDGEDGE